LINEECGMNFVQAVIVYLDTQNYNINFEVSRSFLYKGLHNQSCKYCQLW